MSDAQDQGGDPACWLDQVCPACGSVVEDRATHACEEDRPTTRNPALAALHLFVGEWSMTARFENVPPVDADARVVFEWLPGEQFLIERWTVPIPEAPDGIAIIGLDPSSEGRYLQHYFDSRGVARVYKMTLGDKVWTLWRDDADFSPLDFRQRYTGTISDDGRTITGSWEICHDGTTWEHDFELSYRKLS